MNPSLTWLLITLGLALFILSAYLDDRDIKSFTDPAAAQTPEAARLLWVRILTRQAAALMLVLMLDALATSVSHSVPVIQQLASRFFISLAAAANLWQLPRYYRLSKQAVARARALETLRGENPS